MQEKRKLHYGWVIVACSMLLLAIDNGAYGCTNSLFVIPVTTTLGITRAQFSLTRTITMLLAGLLMPVYAKLTSKFGVRKILLVGGTLFSLSVAAFGLAKNLFQLYVISVFNGIFFNVSYFLVFGILLSNWFIDKKGTATGIVFAGTGLGGTFTVPLLTKLIATKGWQFTYEAMGITGMIAMFIIVFFFVFDTPEERGMEPYRDLSKAADAGKDEEEEVSQTLQQAVKTPTFWMMFVALFLIAIYCSACNTHTAPYLTDIGYDSATVSLLVSTFMVFLMLGKILLGYLYDKLGCFAGNLFVSGFALAFPLLALLASFLPAAFAYVITIGVAAGALSVPVPILLQRYFGKEHYASIYSVFTSMTMIGNSVGMPIMGAVFDNLGTYRPGYVGLFVGSCIIAFCFITIELRYQKAHKK